MPNDGVNWEPSKFDRFMSNFWDSFTMPPVRRHYVNRIDFFIFSYSLTSYIVKALDQNNFSNAFVSGMQTDLKLCGQQRDLFTTSLNMGYLTGSVPNQVINRIRPSIWIPICEIMLGNFNNEYCGHAQRERDRRYPVRVWIFRVCDVPVFQFNSGELVHA